MHADKEMPLFFYTPSDNSIFVSYNKMSDKGQLSVNEIV